MPKVTVLMPVYNGEKFLREAVESVLNQTYKDYELLIIDDASRDNSAEIIESFGDSRIRLVENEKNMGQMNALNKGLALSRGEYIARMDQDDISLPVRLEKQTEALDKNPDVPLVFSDTYIINSKGQRRKGTVLRRVGRAKKCSFEEFLKGEFHICQCTTMIRKKIFDIVGLYNPAYKIAAEHELYHFRLLYKHDIKFIKEPLTEYRLYGGNTTSNVEQTAGEILDVLVNFGKTAPPGYRKDVLDKAISGQLATLSLCGLFEHRRRSSIATALNAIRKDAGNVKAYGALLGALLFPRSVVKKIENRRKRYLGQELK